MIGNSRDVPLVIMSNGKAYGPNDGLERSGDAISFITPVSDLIADPRVFIRPLFSENDTPSCSSLVLLDDYRPPNQLESLSFVRTEGDNSIYLLYGSRLNSARVLSPFGTVLHELGSDSIEGLCTKSSDAVGRQPVARRDSVGSAVRVVCLSSNAARESGGQLLLKRDGEPPLMLKIPDPPRPSGAGTNPHTDYRAKERIVAGADQAVIVGGGFDGLQGVMFGAAQLPFAVSQDKASVTVSGLVANKVSTEAGSRTLLLRLKTSGVPVVLDVVSGKIETVLR